MKRPMPRWLWPALVCAVMIVAASIFTLYGFSGSGANRTSADFGPAPSFTLTDQATRQVSSSDLTGKTLLVSFIYTSCPDICGLTTQRMAGVQSLLQKDDALKQRVRLLSVTVDPSHDTPEVLAAYARENGADPALWSFLTGPADQIRQVVVDGFHLGMESLPATGNGSSAQTPLVSHSDRVLLIDGRGRIRAMYHADELTPSQVLVDIRKL